MNSDVLREMLELSERKETLIKELRPIEGQLLSIFSSKAGTLATPLKSKKVKVVASKTPAPLKIANDDSSKRPSMKKAIFAALAEAGSLGIKVTDLAKKMGVKPANVHTWFSTNIKKFTEIERLGAGHFRMNQS